MNTDHPSSPLIFPLTAKSESALYSVVNQLTEYLAINPDVALTDVAYSYQTARVHYDHRVAFVAASREALLEQCADFINGKSGITKARFSSVDHNPNIVFLFTGQGTQYAGMGHGLYQTSAVFKQAIDRCAAVLDKLLPFPLTEILFNLAEPDRVHQTAITQPALFALEYALTQHWMAWGLQPNAVLGHSLGEWVGACIAGAYSVEDACALVFQRGHLMQSQCQTGGMASVSAPLFQIEPIIKPFEMTITAQNGERNLVMGGTSEQLTLALKALGSAGIRCKLLDVSHAFHSPMMTPMLESFGDKVNAVHSAALQIPLISNLDGEPRHSVDAQYWCQQIRQPVMFAKCIEKLLSLRVDLVVEIGPQPVFARLIEGSCDEPPAMIGSLIPGQADLQSMYQNIAKAWCEGLPMTWSKQYSLPLPKRLHLPSYPYQRKHLAIDGPPLTQAAQTTVKAKAALSRQSSLEAVQKVIKAIWCEVLSTEAIDAESDFDELGADSLIAAELLARTKQVTGLKLTLAQMYQQKTLGNIAQMLFERLADADLEPQPQQPQSINQPATPAKAQQQQQEIPLVELSRNPLKNVLLLGSESLLGIHLLRELCETTAAAIYCLGDRADIRAQLQHYFDDSFSPGQRLTYFAELSDFVGAELLVDSIIDVSHTEGLTTNMDNLNWCLDQVMTHPKIHLHYVSSNDDSHMEQLTEAQNHGAQISRYCCAHLVGHGVSGKMSQQLPSNPFYLKAQSIINSGVCDDNGLLTPITPVNYAAAALTELVQQGANSTNPNGVWQLDSSEPLTNDALNEAIRSLGYPLMSIDQSTQANDPLYRVCQQSQQAIQQAGVFCPVNNKALLTRLLTHAINIQFLTKPLRWALRSQMEMI